MAQTTVSMPASWRSSTPGRLRRGGRGDRLRDRAPRRSEPRRSVAPSMRSRIRPILRSAACDQHGEIRGERRPLPSIPATRPTRRTPVACSVAGRGLGDRVVRRVGTTAPAGPRLTSSTDRRCVLSNDPDQVEPPEDVPCPGRCRGNRLWLPTARVTSRPAACSSVGELDAGGGCADHQDAASAGASSGFR